MYQLTQHIKEPTRISKDNMPERMNSSGVLALVSLPYTVSRKKDLNMDNFNHDLKCALENFAWSNNNPDILWQNF